MYDHELYLRTLDEFTAKMLVPYDAKSVLEELADRISEVLGLIGAGVSLERDGRLEFHAGYGPRVTAVERAQEESQVGPCVTAYGTGRVVTVERLADEGRRWPHYCQAAATADISSVASIPMRQGDRTFGVVDLYGRRPRDWPEADLHAASVMTNLATLFWIQAETTREHVERVEQLERALVTRVDIEQAKGVLAARHGISPDEGFDRLRRHARDRNATLREVARAVVHGTLEI